MSRENSNNIGNGIWSNIELNINLRVAITVRVLYILTVMITSISPGIVDHVECERFEVQARTSQYPEWMYMKRKDSRKLETHEI